jgi:shikimate dehydrogenase
MIRAAVLGSPIFHSLSPVLHRAAYRALGVEGEYEGIEVVATELKQFIASRDRSWTGFSLTMPLKEEVLKIADSVDPLALRIQSANTLIRSDSGWHALTTDVGGFQNALAQHAVEDFKKVVIIGAGATARAAAASCDAAGREITVVNRSKARESSMRRAASKSAISFIDWNSQLPKADLIINTTPSQVADVFVSQFTSRPEGCFFEALYNPWPTKLLARWRSLGGKSIDGLDLLVHQAVDQVALMCYLTLNRSQIAPILRAAGLAVLEN